MFGTVQNTPVLREQSKIKAIVLGSKLRNNAWWICQHGTKEIIQDTLRNFWVKNFFPFLIHTVVILDTYSRDSWYIQSWSAQITVINNDGVISDDAYC